MATEFKATIITSSYSFQSLEKQLYVQLNPWTKEQTLDFNGLNLSEHFEFPCLEMLYTAVGVGGGVVYVGIPVEFPNDGWVSSGACSYLNCWY